MSQIKQLFLSQIEEWPLAKKNYAALSTVRTKEFEFDDFHLKVQFNPSRIVSSSAKVDSKSIQARKCFLCPENRPSEQQAIEVGVYQILINPFPIFTEHFTVPKIAHLPQTIDGHFEDMLDFANTMSGFTIFYNGPQCGASAPDHFHFQAGLHNMMPIDYQIDKLKEKHGQQIENSSVQTWTIEDGMRHFFVMESTDKKDLSKRFYQLFKCIERFSVPNEEPLMNILANKENDIWRVVIFPRGERRPWQYFEEGEKHIMISPASVEMGGLLITPLEKDFDKINKTDIKSIMNQASIKKEVFDKVITLFEQVV